MKTKIIERFIYYSISSALNLFVPLYLYSLIIESIGESNFGEFIFMVFVANLLWVVIDLNQSITGTIDLKTKDSRGVIKKVISLRFIISFLFLPLYLFYFSDFPLLSILIYSSLIARAFNITFFFIFKNKEKQIAVVNLIVKAVSLTALLYFFTVNEKTYATFLVVNEVAVSLIFLAYGPKWETVDILGFKPIKHQFKRTLSSGVTNIVSAGYSFVPVFTIQAILGPKYLAMFAVLEKIFRGVSNLSAPINQILLTSSKNKSKKNHFFPKSFWTFFAMLVTLTALILILKNQILFFFDFSNDIEIYTPFTISLLIPIIVFFSRYFFINVILLNNKDSLLPRAYFITLFSSIILNILLVYAFNLQLLGVILAIVLTELTCCLILLRISLKRNYAPI